MTPKEGMYFHHFNGESETINTIMAYFGDIQK
jgi:hypothetical protein